jgi:hypothetical protein
MGLLSGVGEVVSPGRRSALGINFAGLEEMPGVMGAMRLVLSGFAIDWDGAFAAIVTGFVMYRKQNSPAMAVLTVSIQG